MRTATQILPPPGAFATCSWCGHRTPVQRLYTPDKVKARSPITENGASAHDGKRLKPSARVIGEILELYQADEVNWSAVARKLGISRQAVHQSVRRRLAPVAVQTAEFVEPDGVPLKAPKYYDGARDRTSRRAG